jgi:crotonobetainyl-CoA:carnitine CoA-transferase CaiB-like acyl-CoA transferase
MTRKICEGLTVLELGAGSISASFAGMHLADNGARVVKVEPPEGDRLRSQLQSGFLTWNRGKESLVLDLRTEAGRESFRVLAAGADVILNGLSPDTARRWGLDDARVRVANPRLVYCQFSGFGPKGAYARLKAYEGVIAAKCGIYTAGEYGFRDAPIFSPAPFASIGAGHMGVAGVLAALIVREKTGRGQRVDASLMQGLEPLDYFGVTATQVLARAAGEGPGSLMAKLSGGASRLNFTVPSKDGRWILVTQMLPKQSQALSRVLGLEHTISDPRYARQPFFGSAEDAQAFEDMVWEVFRKKTYAEWEPLLQANPDIAVEVAWTSEEGLTHPQIVHNGEAIEVCDDEFGTIRQVGPVARFSDSPARIEKSAPRLDEHGQLSAAGSAVATGGNGGHRYPLEGFTIIELGYFYAMPYGLTLAASLGARVIKLEDSSGDPIRVSFFGPEIGGAKLTQGKESLSLDLRKPEAQQVVHELVRHADVFVCGFRPGAAERMNLGYATLAEINPRLLYVHATGYGLSGPYSHRPIYAWQAASVGGAFRRHAGPWLDPERLADYDTTEAQLIVLPHMRGPTDGDSNAAMAVFTTLLLGLYDQQRTGRGQHVSTTMIGGNALMYSDDFNTYPGKIPVPRADEDNWGLNALYRLYESSSGWIFLAALTSKEWQQLTSAIGRDDLAGDERFGSAAARSANDGALAGELADVFLTRSAAEWEELLSARGVGCAKVWGQSHSQFTISDPALKEAGLVAEVEHPALGRLLRAAPPVAFSETGTRVAAGCVAGQHTRAILAELGYSEEQVATLLADEAVFAGGAERKGQ